MREAVVVASSRTPLAKSGRGSFNMTLPSDLAAHCISDALGKVPQLDRKEVEDVILGCGQPHGSQGHNIARVAAMRAGLPVSVAGLTINRFCSSGLNAIAIAANYIVNEGADVVFGGGVESITMMQRDSSPNPWVKEHLPGIYMTMGDTAEVVAKRYKVTRQAQDEYSLSSQQRTARAQQEGRPARRSARSRSTSRRTSATAATRRWTACCRCRPCSTRAPRAVSPPATRRSSRTGRPPPC